MSPRTTTKRLRNNLVTVFPVLVTRSPNRARTPTLISRQTMHPAG